MLPVNCVFIPWFVCTVSCLRSRPLTYGVQVSKVASIGKIKANLKNMVPLEVDTEEFVALRGSHMGTWHIDDSAGFRLDILPNNFKVGMQKLPTMWLESI